jgi:hypothetical protein
MSIDNDQIACETNLCCFTEMVTIVKGLAAVRRAFLYLSASRGRLDTVGCLTPESGK